MSCSTLLGSFLGAIELTDSCAFVCKVRYFDALIGETSFAIQAGGLTYLPLWKNVSNYLQGIKI